MITTNIDFSHDTKQISDNWKQFLEGGKTLVELSDGSIIEANNCAGFVWDGASIPPIPFIRHWRYNPKLYMASYIHDLYFIHQYTDYKRASWVMNDIMKQCGVSTLMRIIIYKAVKSNIAKRLFSGRNIYDEHNMSLSSIKETKCIQKHQYCD